jgi:hypothetical protein
VDDADTSIATHASSGSSDVALSYRAVASAAIVVVGVKMTVPTWSPPLRAHHQEYFGVCAWSTGSCAVSKCNSQSEYCDNRFYLRGLEKWIPIPSPLSDSDGTLQADNNYLL